MLQHNIKHSSLSGGANLLIGASALDKECAFGICTPFQKTKVSEVIYFLYMYSGREGAIE